MITCFDPFPLLETERLTLRPLLPGDAEQVLFLRSNEGVLQYISSPRAQTLEDASEFIERIGRIQANNEGITWAMVPKGEEKMIGSICYWNLEKEHDKAEIGYSMHPDYHGKGFMQETMSAVLDYGFATMQIKLLEAITHQDNLRSRRLLERNGFTRDAKLEQERVGMEEPEYATIYSIRRM